MTKGMKRLLAVGVILFLVGVLGAGISRLVGWRTGEWSWDWNWKGFRNAAFTIEESYGRDEIQHIALNMAAGNVTIQLGDRFAISGQGLYADFQSRVEDGVWTIGQPESQGGFWRNLFRSSGEVTLTVPRDQALGSLSLTMGAGELDAEGLDTRYLEISCGAGNVDMEWMRAEEIYVDCGVGEVDLSLEGTEADYPLAVSCGVGEVTVGDRHYTSLSRDVETGETPVLQIECGVGSVDVQFSGNRQ